MPIAVNVLSHLILATNLQDKYGWEMKLREVEVTYIKSQRWQLREAKCKSNTNQSDTKPSAFKGTRTPKLGSMSRLLHWGY